MRTCIRREMPFSKTKFHAKKISFVNRKWKKKKERATNDKCEVIWNKKTKHKCFLKGCEHYYYYCYQALKSSDDIFLTRSTIQHYTAMLDLLFWTALLFSQEKKSAYSSCTFCEKEDGFFMSSCKRVLRRQFFFKKIKLKLVLGKTFLLWSNSFSDVCTLPLRSMD